MNWMRWNKDKQSSYDKLLLVLSTRLAFDCYLLRLPDSCVILPHKDSAPEGYSHHRLNILLRRPCIGSGETIITGPCKSWLDGRVIYFRPDLYEHELTKVEFIWPSSMYILSISWLRKKSWLQ